MSIKKILALILSLCMLIQLPDGFILTEIMAEGDLNNGQIIENTEEDTVNTENNSSEQVVTDTDENNPTNIENVQTSSDDEKEVNYLSDESGVMVLEANEVESYPFGLSDLDVTTNEAGITTITIIRAEDLIKLSHCDPATYQKAILNLSISGSTSLVGEITVNEANYKFAGLGSKDHPFEGAISGTIYISLDRALFRAVSSNVSFNNNTLYWSGSGSKPMLADMYQLVNETETVFNHVKVNIDPDANYAVMGPLFGEIYGQNGTLKIDDVVDYSNANVNIVQDGNAGLICNTLTNGKIVVSDTFVTPNDFSVTSKNANAGGLVGEMKPGTELVLGSSLHNLSVTGNLDAGGIVGHAVNASVSATGSVTGDISVTSTTSNAGGIVGYNEYNADHSLTDVALSSIQIGGSVSLKAPNATGGMYGLLKLDKKIRAKLALQSDSTVTQSTDNCAYYGGLIGHVDGSATDNTVAVLSIDGGNNTILSNSGDNNSSEGGIIGFVGGESTPVTVFVKNITVNEAKPGVTVTEDAEAWFGGLAGTISNHSVVSMQDNLTIITQDNIVYGGGIVGNMHPGSVLSFSGTTDLNGVQYTSSDKTGQLVGKQDSALIFAKGSGNDSGWTYVRSGQKPILDDIGNYGQVIRLKNNEESQASTLSNDLFHVQTLSDEGDNSAAGLLSIKPYTGSGFAISNEDDFVLLSVLWQTHGVIAASNIPEYSELANADISFLDNIDLTGTGITGLTRDMKETESVFSGTLNGKNGISYVLTLSIGEAFGCFKDENNSNVSALSNDDGNGRVYRHNALGLFASSSGLISNLTIDGTINVESYSNACYVGGIAGLIEGGTFSVSNVTASEVINCSNDTKKAIYAGGLYGAVSNTSNITFGGPDNPVTSKAVIKVGDVHDGKYACLGGLIGAVIEENAKSPVNQSRITIQNVLLRDPTVENETLNLDGISITDGQSFFAGGLIGAIIPYSSDLSDKIKTVIIKNVTVDGYSIESNNSSTDNSITAGLLGSLWAFTDVIFGDAVSSSDTFAVNVVNGSNIANNISYFGGLFYAASGKWTINNKGIDLSGATFSAPNANSFGLLVQDAYNGSSSIGDRSVQRGGLYIELTAYWDDAYILNNGSSSITTVVKSGTSYDEFAAYTAESDVFSSEKNGVISLHTKDAINEGRLLMNGTEINSYQNRSETGMLNNINSHSRYYYNLDRMYTVVNNEDNNNCINTSAELMLWSVVRYCAANLRSYFTVKDVKYSVSEIGGSSSDEVASFDLKGYSYYPIDLLNTNLTIKNAAFAFYNKQIEEGENAKNNKNTSDATQHKGMHCGLFRNYLRQSSNKSTFKAYQLSSLNLEFSGTIGMVNNKSGVLFCGQVEGNDTNGNNIYTVAVSDVAFNGLLVREMMQDTKPDYAPLFIAESSSYSMLSLARVSAKGYGSNVMAATSLIGKAGVNTINNIKPTQVNLSFSEMNLPSQKSNSMFTKAIFLESFEYAEDGVGTAIYNFTKDDQGKGLVTFGAEIDGTTEYVGLQLWYYDENGYGTDSNLVTDGDITASKVEGTFNYQNIYLPYVHCKYKTTGFNYHEIKVNHRIVDIVTGCGTYADPYVIRFATELDTIAAFLQTGTPRKNWRISITADQTKMCDRVKGESSKQSLDTIYKCDGTQWNLDMDNPPDGAKTSLSNDTIRYYLLSAYYDIQDDMELTDFVGLGNKTYVFRGVVTCTNEEPVTITLKGSNTSRGLIPYSYGSVVKNLNIYYKKEDDKQLVIYSTEKDLFAPSAFFGGVIGVIMGGDNIIDNVSVSMDDGFLSLIRDNNNGDKRHLIQVGGYVGSISGGGVIFRNMNGKSGMSKNWLDQTQDWKPDVAKDAYQSLYVNPFVGRVLDGFAFSEDCEVNNTDKNYVINKLDSPIRNDEGEIVSKGYIIGDSEIKEAYKGGLKLTINNEVGLLVFSALLNSGASAGPALDVKGTRAYAGGYNVYDGNYQFGNAQFGKVRCAAYDQIGVPDQADNDFKVSLNDDRLAPGLQANGGSSIRSNLTNENNKVNMCYLAACFGDRYSMFGAMAYVSDLRYVFDTSQNTTFNMTQYGNGYQGIGCRYKANAGTNLDSETPNYDRVVPYTRYVNGNNVTVKATINVREYSDDDFWTMGVGAVFSYVYYRNDDPNILSENDNCAARDITVQDSTLTLKYYNSKGEEDNSSNNTRKAGVGGFAGAQVSVQSVGTLKNIYIEDTTINGGYQAGGVFGSVGIVAFEAATTKTHFVYTSPVKSSISLIDCHYSGLNINGYFYSGGFIGQLISKDTTNRFSGLTAIQTTKQGSTEEYIISTSATNDHQISAGGLIGHFNGNKGTIQVDNDNRKYENNIFTDINVFGYGKAAGLIGWIQSATACISNTIVQNTENSQATIKTESITNNVVNYSVVGGLVGRGQDCKLLLSSCQLIKLKLGNSKETAVGGLVGDSYVKSNGIDPYLETYDCSVEDCQLLPGNKTNEESYAGGYVGILGGTWLGSNLYLSNTVLAPSTSNKLYRGLLVGRCLDITRSYTLPFAYAHIAGVSIQELPSEQKGMNEIGNFEAVKDNCYFAYADYNEKPSNPSNNLLETTAISPFVVTSPVSTLSVRKDGTEYSLFGDGSKWQRVENGYSLKAETILNDAKNDESTGFKYSRTGVTSFDFAKRFARYSDNQKDLGEGFDSDFPALLVSSDNTQVITDYLNLLTNGGYSQALTMSPGSVSVDISRYVWNSTDNCFDYSLDKPSLRKESDGTFAVTKEYDNDMNRFTLLTVTFTENSQIDSSNHNYVVHVPIIVRRVVEIDFTATFYYGTNLNAQAYDGKQYHVLDSFGNTISAYLTYQYNSAYGVNVKYGWQNFVDEGGDIAQVMEKTLVFEQKNAFPSGTQLTLVDESTGISYYKTLGEGIKEVSMSEFKSAEGPSYSSKKIGEVLAVSVSENPSTEGKFIQVDENGKPIGSSSSDTFEKPTVYANGKYYRLPKTDGTEDSYDKYEVTVTDSQPVENYYLIITIPSSDAEAVNGQLTTRLDGGIAHHINYKQRHDNTFDNHQNTASTYLISKGYQQNIEETLSSRMGKNQSTQKISGIDRTLYVSVRSEVSFPNEQIYNENDALYQAFTANLQTYITSDSKTESAMFPSKTGGEVKFYVTDESGNYYYQDDAGWHNNGQTTKAVASYDWSSTGDSMELLFSKDGSKENMINLQGVRDLIKGSKTSGTSRFYVEAVLEAVIPATGIDVIPESKLVNGLPENYTKLTYISRLSTQQTSISYSSTRSALSNTQIQYYREKSQENQLVYDADNVDQLGINLNDLVDDYLNQDGTCSRIETTAWFNLSGVRNLEEILRNSAGVKYTLSLQSKGSVNEYPDDKVLESNSYIQLSPTLPDQRYNATDNNWSWIVARDQYIDAKDDLIIGSVFDGSAFTEKIPVWVRIDNVETLNHLYSNYKLNLTVEIMDNNGNPLIAAESDYLVYTLTKIKPEFID